MSRFQKIFTITMIIVYAYLFYVVFLKTEYANAAVDNRIKIAVIDTGLDLLQDDISLHLCRTGHRSFVDNAPLRDYYDNKHGTNVAGIIAHGISAKKYCLVIIKWAAVDTHTVLGLTKAIKYAVSINVKYMNISVEGGERNEAEVRALRLGLTSGIKISVAAGNAHNDLDFNCNTYPACYIFELKNDNFHVVGSDTYDRRPYSNFGKFVKWEDGTEQGFNKLTGTSQATAVHTVNRVRYDD